MKSMIWRNNFPASALKLLKNQPISNHHSVKISDWKVTSNFMNNVTNLQEFGPVVKDPNAQYEILEKINFSENQEPKITKLYASQDDWLASLAKENLAEAQVTREISTKIAKSTKVSVVNFIGYFCTQIYVKSTSSEFHSVEISGFFCHLDFM